MNELYDVIIVGAGPSALSAAIYAGRYGLKTLIVERQVLGGQMSTTGRIENYPGIAEEISGFELASRMFNQAQKFGVTMQLATVTNLENKGDHVAVATDNGNFDTKTVVLATGSSYRHLNIPGEAEIAHYCATCDGAFYRDKNVITIGGGNSAVTEALYLAEIANHVTMLVRSYIKADQVLAGRLRDKIATGKITLLEGWTPVEMMHTDNGITVRATHDGEERVEHGDGAFVFAGHVPSTDFLQGTDVQLDDAGYIIVDANQQTTMPRVYAAGDVRSGSKKQIITATASGAETVINIQKFLRAN